MRVSTDLIGAIAALTCSVFAFILLLATVSKSDIEHRVMLSGIPAGESSYVLMSGDECPGKFSVLVDGSDSATTMHITGEIRSSYGNTVQNSMLSGEVFFNPLGQLTNSSFSVKSGGRNVALSTSNPNPIQITADVGAEKPFQLSVPGPLLISHDRDGTYSIRYANLPSRMAGNKGLNLPLHAVPAASAPKNCSRGSKARVDLLPWIMLAQRGMASLGAQGN